MNCGVYKITDIKTGDYYIGSSKNLRVRKNQHYSDMRCGRHTNSHLQRVYNKGRDLSFEVYIYTRPEDRFIYEQRCLDILKPELNKTLDALAPMDGKNHSKEYCEIQRQRALNPNSPLKRPEAIANRSGDNHYMRQPDYDKSKHPSKNPEIVAKRNIKISGDNHYMNNPNWDRNNHSGKLPKVRAAVSARMTGEKHPQSKLTLEQVIEIILSNKSYSELMAEYGIKRSQVCRIKTRQSWEIAHKILDEKNALTNNEGTLL
jgi:hypothetical protein